jgi:hypothetical protein
MVYHRTRMRRIACLLACAACGRAAHVTGDARGDGAAGDGDASTGDDAATADGTGGSDSGTGNDGAVADGPSNVITGGPCMSATPGATAYRIRWADAGGTAQVVYEVDGLPDHSRDHAGAFGFQIGFVPQFVDPFLGDGGLQLDSDDFVDLELTTVGVHAIAGATLSIYGRSFDTTTSGSFNWQTFDGTGSSATDSVSNVAPYRWYSADMTTEISPGDPNVLVRIKAGPSSGVLVVNRIEICMTAS